MEPIGEALKKVLDTLRPIPEIKERILLDTKIPIKRTKGKKGAPKSELIIFQHNNLVEADYKLSLQEKRIVLWLISQTEPNDEDFKVHTLCVQNFMEIVGLTGNANYEELQKITLELMKKVLTIKNIEKRTTMQVAWLHYACYAEKEGRVELSFAPELKPFLLNIKSHFTAIKLSDLMQFSSIYAIRIYELLKQYEKIGERIIEVADIRKHCGVESKLKQYKEFKERVILIAQREINSKSDVEFEFEEIKTVRKITKIKFKISKNKKNTKQHNTVVQEFKRPPPVFFTLEEFGLTKRMINKIMRDEKEGEITNAIKAVEAQMKRGGVKNPKAMLVTAIKEKWRPDIYKKRTQKPY